MAKKNARRAYNMAVLPNAQKVQNGKTIFWIKEPHGMAGITEAEAEAVRAYRNWEDAAQTPWGRAHRLSWQAVDTMLLRASEQETGAFAKEVAKYGLTAQEAEAFAVVATFKDRLIHKKEKAIKAEIKAIEKDKGQ